MSSALFSAQTDTQLAACPKVQMFSTSQSSGFRRNTPCQTHKKDTKPTYLRNLTSSCLPHEPRVSFARYLILSSTRHSTRLPTSFENSELQGRTWDTRCSGSSVLPTWTTRKRCRLEVVIKTRTGGRRPGPLKTVLQPELPRCSPSFVGEPANNDVRMRLMLRNPPRSASSPNWAGICRTHEDLFMS